MHQERRTFRETAANRSTSGHGGGKHAAGGGACARQHGSHASSNSSQWKQPSNSRCLNCSNLSANCNCPRAPHVDPNERRARLQQIGSHTPYFQSKVRERADQVHHEERAERDELCMEYREELSRLFEIMTCEHKLVNCVIEEGRRRTRLECVADSTFVEAKNVFIFEAGLCWVMRDERDAREDLIVSKENEFKRMWQANYTTLAVLECIQKEHFKRNVIEDQLAVRVRELVGVYRALDQRMSNNGRERAFLIDECLSERRLIEEHQQRRFKKHCVLREEGLILLARAVDERNDFIADHKESRARFAAKEAERRKGICAALADSLEHISAVAEEYAPALQDVRAHEVEHRQRVEAHEEKKFRLILDQVDESLEDCDRAQLLKRRRREDVLAFARAKFAEVYDYFLEGANGIVEHEYHERLTLAGWMEARNEELECHVTLGIDLAYTIADEEHRAYKELGDLFTYEYECRVRWMHAKQDERVEYYQHAKQCMRECAYTEKVARAELMDTMHTEHDQVLAWMSDKFAQRNEAVFFETRDRIDLQTEEQESFLSLRGYVRDMIDALRRLEEDRLDAVHHLHTECKAGRDSIVLDEQVAFEFFEQEFRAASEYALQLQFSREQGDAMFYESKHRVALGSDEQRGFFLCVQLFSSELERFERAEAHKWLAAFSDLEFTADLDRTSVSNQESSAFDVLWDTERRERALAVAATEERVRGELLERQAMLLEEERHAECEDELVALPPDSRLSTNHLRHSIAYNRESLGGRRSTLAMFDDDAIRREVIASRMSMDVSNLPPVALRLLSRTLDESTALTAKIEEQSTAVEAQLATGKKRNAILDQKIASKKEAVAFYRNKLDIDRTRHAQELQSKKEKTKKLKHELAHETEKIKAKRKQLSELVESIEVGKDRIRAAW